MSRAASSLLPRLLGVVGAGQMGAGIAQVRQGERQEGGRARR